MKQNILLIGINAKFIHSNLAIYSLKSYADNYYTQRPCGCKLDIAEYTINQSEDSILADLYVQKPDVAAFSCYIWNWGTIKNLLCELPKILPETKLWLGGPEVSFDADKIIAAFPQLTGIMIGEGEKTFLELLKHYWENTAPLNAIKGIATKEGFTGIRDLVDINNLPFLYNAGNDTLVRFQNRILYYESQRGCPFCCAYCLSSIDKKVRLRDIDTVKIELKFFLDQKVQQVKFIDRTFNCNKKHSISIWNFLKENDNGITNFHFEIAADLLDDEQLEIMQDMRPGLIQLEIGVQSTNETTLHAINRKTDIARLRENVAKIRSFQNIHMHLDLIAGLPYEDYNSFAASYNDVYAMQPNQLQLGFLKVLKGSPIEQQTLQYGIVYNTKTPYEVLYTKWLSYTDILKLKKIEEMTELYYNSNQFCHTLPVLVHEFASPFQMYEALAEFYQEKGYFTNAPSRTYRYQALLEFASLVASDKQQLFTELLLFDMYVRENLKSRPAFAPENTIDKDMLRRFFEIESKEHAYLKNYDGYKSIQLLRMTHIEQFTYPVWLENSLECATLLDVPAYILFDYENRSALTHNAAFYQIMLY